jgi:hypothetical protein
VFVARHEMEQLHQLASRSDSPKKARYEVMR